MGRAPCCDKNGLKRGPWTPEEDQKLINYIQTHGPGSWRTLPKNADLQRCGKSCRLRWTNYLRPDIKRGRFSFEEEEAIIQLHGVLGNKWSAIAARLPGRTDNEIKNYWNTHIRKRMLKMGIDPVTHSPRLDLLNISSILRTALLDNSSLMNLQGLLGSQALMNPELLKLASTLLSMNNANTNLIPQNLQQIQTQVGPQQQFSQFQTPIQTIVESFPSNMANINMSCSNSPENSVPPHNISDDNLTSLQNQVDLPGDLDFVQSPNNMDKNVWYVDSVLSTPLSSSSQTPLNSSSTYLSSGTDQERDSYCSDLFKFEIPESLDISDFL